MTCAICGASIQPDERSGMTYLGVVCEVCNDKIDRLTLTEDANASHIPNPI